MESPLSAVAYCFELQCQSKVTDAVVLRNLFLLCSVAEKNSYPPAKEPQTRNLPSIVLSISAVPDVSRTAILREV